MSFLTFYVAVAVNPSTGTFGNVALNIPSCK